MQSQQITFHDATGVMLAAMGTAGNAYNAQQQAKKDAIRSGAKAGDSYSYSYKVIPPAPGLWSSFTWAWGTADDDGVEVKYRLLDMRTSLGQWKPWGLDMSILLGVTWSKYENIQVSPAGNRDDIFYMGMPVGPKFAMGVLGKGTLSWHVAVDPMLSGILALLGEEWEMIEAGTQFDYRVLSRINLFAKAMGRHTFDFEGNGTWQEYQATAGINIIFGESMIGKKR